MGLDEILFSNFNNESEKWGEPVNADVLEISCALLMR